jgi:hypothetical protein
MDQRRISGGGTWCSFWKKTRIASPPRNGAWPDKSS